MDALAFLSKPKKQPLFALIGDAIVNSGPGLLLVLEKSPDANTLEVTKDIDSALEDLQPGLPGVHFDPHVLDLAAVLIRLARTLRRSQWTAERSVK